MRNGTRDAVHGIRPPYFHKRLADYFSTPLKIISADNRKKEFISRVLNAERSNEIIIHENGKLRIFVKGEYTIYAPRGDDDSGDDDY